MPSLDTLTVDDLALATWANQQVPEQSRPHEPQVDASPPLSRSSSPPPHPRDTASFAAQLCLGEHHESAPDTRKQRTRRYSGSDVPETLNALTVANAG